MREIGRGGTSVVCLAVDLRLKKEWAVKVIPKQAGRRPREAERLAAETDLMRKLDHPALPRIVDIVTDESNYYIVMDYIRGVSLDRVIKERGMQKESTVLDWGIQLCDALRYLHSRKPPIVYRDMKPANVIVTPDGALKLVDLGISREYQGSRTAAADAFGTRGYAPPEQRDPRRTDARSDIYALGMTLHYLLTGADPGTKGYRYRSVRQLRPALSAGLEAVIDKCTAPDPGERYQTCEELLYDLRHPQGAAAVRERRCVYLRHLLRFAAAAAAILAVCGLISHTLNSRAAGRLYERKISISAAAPYEAREESYLEAIGLCGSDPRAYRELLALYRERGVFGERESRRFTEAYDAHKEEFDRTGDDHLDLAYDAGTTFFYLYSGTDSAEDRFVERAMKAYPYFAEVVSSGNSGYRYYGIACSYAKIGEFYAQYTVDAANVREPQKRTYEELLQAFRKCLREAENYEAEDGAYVKMTMYKSIADLLNAHRRGFAAAGVEKTAIWELYGKIRQNTEELYVSQQQSIDLQREILAVCGEYPGNVERAYENTAKWETVQ